MLTGSGALQVHTGTTHKDNNQDAATKAQPGFLQAYPVDTMHAVQCH